MKIQGAWTDRCLDNQKKTAKIIFQTIYLQPCISIIHWNKLYVNLFWKFPGLKIIIIAISNREFITSNFKGGKLQLKMISHLQLLTT